ncbi:hypothetical protein [Streptomyces zhihengii]
MDTAAARTTRAWTVNPPTPLAMLTTAAPASATTLPRTMLRLTRSLRNRLPSSTLKAGTIAISRLAVPAVTFTSPQLSRSW